MVRLVFSELHFGIFIHLTILRTTTSLGVAWGTPFAPSRKGAFKDDIFISPLWKQEQRPIFLKPKNKIREPKISRKWIKGG